MATESVMTRACLIGVFETGYGKLDAGPAELAQRAALGAVKDAGIGPQDIALVVLSNSMGGTLSGQDMVRAQVWLRGLGFGDTPMLNIENACAGGASAVYNAMLAVRAGIGPVLVVAVEKMFTGSRELTIDALERGLPADLRSVYASRFEDAPSLLMGFNALWARQMVADGRATVEEIAAAAVKARRHGSMNPLAQHRTPLSLEDVLNAPPVVDPLTRPMCSSFTDGACGVVLAPDDGQSPVLRGAVVVSGDGSMDWHDRTAALASSLWTVTGLEAADVDVIEVHDVTAAEEIWTLEAIGLFAQGAAGAATVSGRTTFGGDGPLVNPSGGLIARGHPVGATGLAQIVEVTHHLRGTAGDRQQSGARIGVTFNCGGITDGDASVMVATAIEAR
ncbi:acetyl-CoA acyltransferase [Streptomyces sp. SAI-135]|nr:acetyl-CoA acyltransferase [Streptomyces sp. SAI-090]MDH6573237.1 acetyl-CoA acyltransferase [Streptomyces sp. SAI-117]MDH6614028.1 acetyl-CoA acyltransferase [Streptomyces sp. SAI-135]